jgi:hypothetical protein
MGWVGYLEDITDRLIRDLESLESSLESEQPIDARLVESRISSILGVAKKLLNTVENEVTKPENEVLTRSINYEKATQERDAAIGALKEAKNELVVCENIINRLRAERNRLTGLLKARESELNRLRKIVSENSPNKGFEGKR